MNLGLLLRCLFACTLLIAQAVAEPELPVFRYAANIQVAHFPNHRLITVENTYRNSSERYQFALVPKASQAPLPEFAEGTLVVRTPVERVVAMTTTFVGFIDALDQQERVVGVTEPQFIHDPKIHEGLAEGRIQAVQTGARLDIERMLRLKPELILTTTIGEGSFQVQPQLARAGLPVALSAEYMETSPLARAEWIKFVAAFFEADEEAEIIFDQIAKRYDTLLQRTGAVSQRPTVFCGAPYSGAWYVPGGKSYIAQFIKDAGGDYIWQSDTSAGGIPLDFERVFRKGGMADIWLDPSNYKNLEQLLQADGRFRKFKAYQEGKIYNNTAQMHPKGGNNIWERGIVHPDEVLADLISIFHPDRIPKHEWIYYERLD